MKPETPANPSAPVDPKVKAAKDRDTQKVMDDVRAIFDENIRLRKALRALLDSPQP